MDFNIEKEHTRQHFTAFPGGAYVLFPRNSRFFFLKKLDIYSFSNSARKDCCFSFQKYGWKNLGIFVHILSLAGFKYRCCCITRGEILEVEEILSDTKKDNIKEMV